MNTWSCPLCGRDYPDRDPGSVCPEDDQVLVLKRTLEEHPTARLLGASISGRYQVYGVLGIGGFGEVYAAKDSLENRFVALKTIHSDVDLVAADALNRFRQEAELLKQLASPHVVEVYEINQADDLLYMVLELVPGRSLKSIVAEGKPLALERAIHITCQVLEGLAPAHKMGLIHRDLKPGNIMVNEHANDAVKLIDLGIAKVLGAQKDSVPKTGTGLVLGTVRYMAPEQLKRDGLVSSQTDLYSVGIVFYEMLTGRTPYDGSPAEMAAAHLYHDPPTMPAEIRSELLDTWFSRVMCKSPHERYLDALTMRADLLQCHVSDTVIEVFSQDFLAESMQDTHTVSMIDQMISRPPRSQAQDSPKNIVDPMEAHQTKSGPDALALLDPITEFELGESGSNKNLSGFPGRTTAQDAPPEVTPGSLTDFPDTVSVLPTSPPNARQPIIAPRPDRASEHRMDDLSGLQIEPAGDSLSTESLHAGDYSDALSAPTERITMGDMDAREQGAPGLGNSHHTSRPTEEQNPREAGPSISDTVQADPPNATSETSDNSWLNQSTLKWDGVPSSERRTPTVKLLFVVITVLIVTIIVYLGTAEGHPIECDEMDLETAGRDIGIERMSTQPPEFKMPMYPSRCEWDRHIPNEGQWND